jgi:hypothetical protein
VFAFQGGVWNEVDALTADRFSEPVAVRALSSHTVALTVDQRNFPTSSTLSLSVSDFH